MKRGEYTTQQLAIATKGKHPEASHPQYFTQGSQNRYSKMVLTAGTSPLPTASGAVYSVRRMQQRRNFFYFFEDAFWTP